MSTPSEELIEARDDDNEAYLVLVMLNALHEGVPGFPLVAMSDLSDDQAVRARRAIRAITDEARDFYAGLYADRCGRILELEAERDEARSLALEECAKIAEYRGPFGDAAHQTPPAIAAAIRALGKGDQ